MNEKFFELKKEKQNRILNGILQTFAVMDYNHAITDDIVKAAKISKGLLFHYFENKCGAYQFAYNYAVRYLLLEVEGVKNTDEMDGKELLLAYHRAAIQAMRTYPALLLFLMRNMEETNEEIYAATQSTRKLLLDKLEIIKYRLYVDDTELEETEDTKMLRSMRILKAAVKGLLEEYIEGSGQESTQWIWEYALDFEELVGRLLG